MPDLVPEMAHQHGPIWRIHLQAPALALDVVRFSQSDRDHAVIVPGRSLVAGRGVVGEKIEDQAVLWIFGTGFERELPTQ